MTSSPPDSGYYYANGASNRDVDISAYTWVQPTVIEDDDLMFGGKALSTWYEEERSRLSSGSESGEERRGRERVRKHHSRSGKSHKKPSAPSSANTESLASPSKKAQISRFEDAAAGQKVASMSSPLRKPSISERFPRGALHLARRPGTPLTWHGAASMDGHPCPSTGGTGNGRKCHVLRQMPITPTVIPSPRLLGKGNETKDCYVVVLLLLLLVVMHSLDGEHMQV
ncbi:hypothetical protein G7046_g6205 [Stylonectria norvegica]|nr:hypothetical protein G7046_g6205 [Stylonectria norvegica]